MEGPRRDCERLSVWSWVRPLVVLVTFAGLAEAVDKSKFRTCDQGSFCKRYKAYIDRVKGSGGAEFAHGVDPESVQVSGNTLVAKIRAVNDPAVKAMRLELHSFRDGVTGQCGIVRMVVNEEDPIHPRFRLKEGDVVVQESTLTPDNFKMEKSSQGFKLDTSAPGQCQVTVNNSPFELEFRAGGRLLQRLNGQHFFNFEQYRQKDGEPRTALVDATDVDKEMLWEESFGGHTDTKPRGPAAVGIDVTFEAGAVLTGLAEHATTLDLGKAGFQEPYRFYNLDVFEYELDVPMALYGAVPFVTAVHRWTDGAASASGFFFPNPSEGFVNVDPATPQGSNTWWLFESGVMDIFLFAGPSPEAVMQQYHTVTGWGRMPPISTLGKHQSRWNYVDVPDSVGVNTKFDQHDIPYDVLWLDIEHTDAKKYFTWHPTHFKNPEVLLDALNASKRKLVTIIDPHIKQDSNYDVFNKLKDMDFMTKTKAGAQYDGWCWPGTSFYPDFCNPTMREQWTKFFAMDYYPHNRHDLYTWNDMNEPSVFNGPEVTMPRDNLHKCHTADYGVEHRDVHNVYGFYHQMATVEGQLARSPNIRPFVLTRSFFAGTHRHGAVWTGDNMARWDHLARSVPMLITLCLNGISFVGADVPGFFYDAEPELYLKWHQLGIWYPFYRGHAHLETKRREPWMLGDEVTANIREQVTVRYQMLPTLYTIFAEWSARGLPIMRPVWYHDLDDKNAFDHGDTHFLLGKDILVRAIVEASTTTVDLYLPKGHWYDFWDLRAAPVSGGRSISLNVHRDHIPVYIRDGSIMFKKMRRRRSSGAMAADPYTLVVYGSNAKGRVYIDDGESHENQGGKFIYDEIEFDGSALKSKAAPELPALGVAKGLPNSSAHRLEVERIVFVGLARRPTSASVLMNGQEPTMAQVFADEGPPGQWTATVKKPSCLLGSRWSLKLVY